MNTKAIEIKRHFTERLSQYAAQCGVFFRGFLEHPRMVGSIIPSSRFTMRKMLAPGRLGQLQSVYRIWSGDRDISPSCAGAVARRYDIDRYRHQPALH